MPASDPAVVSTARRRRAARSSMLRTPARINRRRSSVGLSDSSGQTRRAVSSAWLISSVSMTEWRGQTVGISLCNTAIWQVLRLHWHTLTTRPAALAVFAAFKTV